MQINPASNIDKLLQKNCKQHISKQEKWVRASECTVVKGREGAKRRRQSLTKIYYPTKYQLYNALQMFFKQYVALLNKKELFT